MNATALIPVVYIGRKERKVDNVAGSGVVWHGHGDVQPVTPQQWGLLSKYPQIWSREPIDEPVTPVASAASMALGEAIPGGALASAADETPVLGAIATSPGQAAAGLYGTDVLPAHVEISGQMVQLGTVVAAAHAASGLSVDDWNSLVPQIRDQLLIEHLEVMRAAKRPAEPAAPASAPGEVKAEAAPTPAQEHVAQKSAPAPAPRQRRAATAPKGEVS